MLAAAFLALLPLSPAHARHHKRAEPRKPAELIRKAVYLLEAKDVPDAKDQIEAVLRKHGGSPADNEKNWTLTYSLPALPNAETTANTIDVEIQDLGFFISKYEYTAPRLDDLKSDDQMDGLPFKVYVRIKKARRRS